MPPLDAITSFFAVPKDRPHLLIAQAEAFSRQAPLAYLVVMANAVALAITHADSAPWQLTAGAAGLLAVICGTRTVVWWRARNRPLDAPGAAALLRRTIFLAAGLGISFTAWSLALYPYGDAYAKAHVAFYLAITGIAVVLCLMHVRAAAVAVVACVLAPMAVFFWLTGEPVFQATAANVAIVSAAIVFILLKHYREFAALVESRVAISMQADEAQKLSLENSRLASLDALTGLPNRRNFFATLEARLTAAGQSGRSLVVGVVDLDGFKPVNDAFGHAAGDRLLIEVGRRLQALDGYPRFVSRLGGDEFGLIIDRPVSSAELQAFGNAVCASLREPFQLPGIVTRISASVGFCTFPYEGDTAEQLFERADYALYYAKQHLSGSAVIFNDRHGAEIREFGRVEQALRNADLEREMTLAFQPVIDIAAGRTTGFEALARWTRPELGEVSPTIFIRAAERSGQITQVTLHLLTKALRAAAAWPKDLSVAINLSARDISSMETIRRIVEIVRASHVAPHRIDFEITETAIVGDFDQARETLLALRDLGAHIALDDFGTGHSSLSHVRLLPIDQLKIDATFVADIAHHQPSEDIVRTVLELCRNMRLSCVVEGVETREQLDRVEALGATMAQGFYFSMPMPESDVAHYLNQETLLALGRSLVQQGRVALPEGRAVAEPAGLARARG